VGGVRGDVGGYFLLLLATSYHFLLLLASLFIASIPTLSLTYTPISLAIILYIPCISLYMCSLCVYDCSGVALACFGVCLLHGLSMY